ncbi:MAG: hypothetical protein A3F94_00900 [Candidatus Spechtbacteria bacterium RIFCSPLOWO2_12_FULL_38_22]|uniref:Uncharacterized protein n=1 Tax=Candidatus Spechtbacteria bacterium RIFCSPLOWO2_12_FULL_38_22 TaxID=1802165 RepID=A0A1G2HIN0_9BACT|nr:MAG: hypothetical protein A3F94_00900 [Candidatus Spechtbacteria bacterium RIFCSPLOWO2_12_FULL_38_22]
MDRMVAKGKTKNNLDKTSTGGDKTILLGKVLTILILILLWILSPMDKQSLIIWTFLASISLSNLDDAVVTSVFFKETWQWHGAEHKIAYLYSEGIERTKENLNLAPLAHKECGTRIIVFNFLLLTPLWIIYILAFLVNTTFILYLLILSAVFVISFFKATKSGFQYKVLILISIWIQQRFTTKEPKDWQMKQAFELAKELDAKLVELGYNI